MVVAGDNVVVAANMLGKIKTVTQIIAIITAFVEPVLQYVAKLIVGAVTNTLVIWRTDIVPLTWITIALAVVMTVWSGINYLKSYWKYLDPEK